VVVVPPTMAKAGHRDQSHTAGKSDAQKQDYDWEVRLFLRRPRQHQDDLARGVDQSRVHLDQWKDCYECSSESSVCLGDSL